MPFRAENRHTTLTLIAILVSIFLVGAGVMFWLAEREDDRQERAAYEREVADRAYADCLTDFAADLVDTLDTRTTAAARYERVRTRLETASADKDRALDRLLFVTELARRTPRRQPSSSSTPPWPPVSAPRRSTTT